MYQQKVLPHGLHIYLSVQTGNTISPYPAYLACIHIMSLKPMMPSVGFIPSLGTIYPHLHLWLQDCSASEQVSLN